MTSDILDEKTGRYLPILYPEEKPFWEAAKAHELKLQCCKDCGKIRYPIGPTCPTCLSNEFAWQTMSGKGVVDNFIIYHKAYTPYLETKVPYAVVQVKIAEGPRLTTNMLGIPPHDIEIGMEVRATYEEVTDDVTLLQFEPVPPGGE